MSNEKHSMNQETHKQADQDQAVKDSQKPGKNYKAWLLGLLLFVLIGFIFYSSRSENPESPINISEESSVKPQSGWSHLGMVATNLYYVKGHKLYGIQPNNKELFSYDLKEGDRIAYGKAIAVLTPDFSLRLLDPQSGEVRNEISAEKAYDLKAIKGPKDISYALFFKDRIRLYDRNLKLIDEILDLNTPYNLAVQGERMAWLEKGPLTAEDQTSEEEGVIFWDPGISPLPENWPNRSFLGLKGVEEKMGLPSQRPYLALEPLGEQSFAAMTKENLLIFKGNELIKTFPLVHPKSWSSGYIFACLDGDRLRRFSEEGEELEAVSLSFEPEIVKVSKDACYVFGQGKCAKIGKEVEEFPLTFDPNLEDPFIEDRERLEVFTSQGLKNLDSLQSFSDEDTSQK